MKTKKIFIIINNTHTNIYISKRDIEITRSKHRNSKKKGKKYTFKMKKKI